MNGTLTRWMKRGFTLRNVGIAGALLVMLMMVFLAVGVPASHAAGAGTGNEPPTVVKVGQDVLIPAGDVVKGVFVVGGNVTINGTVEDTVVTVGGDVMVNGSVSKAVVSVGGDVTVASTASVGSGMKAGDSSVVTVGGKATVDPGAAVTGKVSKVTGLSWSGVGGTIARHGPWHWNWLPFGVAGGFGQLLLLIVAAVIVAAVLPRQHASVKEQLSERFFPSLGWGALTGLVIIPAFIFILVISIIGIIPLLLIVVPALFLVGLFGVVGVAGAIGDRVMGQSSRRESVMLVAVIGALILGVVAMIPVAGALVMFVACIVGLGATVLAIGKSQRDKRERAAGAVATPPAA
jgi:hypothetical protein